MEVNLAQLIILTVVIHLIDTLAYSVRLNSVRSGQFALSLSLFNIFVLISRTANTLQGPLIGGLIDQSITLNTDPLNDIRRVIMASTTGTALGILLIPTFLRVFSAAVKKLELSGSVPSIIVEALHLNNLKRMVKSATTPRKSMLQRLRFREIPKRLLLLNTFITGIYTVGVLAAYYSAFFVLPEHRLAASASSGLINGVASILLTLFVDPKAAVITDQALRGKRPHSDVKTLVVLLIGTKFLGTLLAQLLILPAALAIARFYTV